MSARAPVSSTLSRAFAAAVLAAAACAAGAAAVVPDDDPPRPIADPHYGDALFHFFQERYFDAVSTLMVSQHFDRVANHADEAEVLRGGMLLSYGLHREAGEIFARLIERSAPRSVQDRAWYHLAKIRYQRGLLVEADEALARVGDRLPPALDDDRRLLAANVAMARGRFADAAQGLEALAQRPSVSAYARYNLGVALVRSGDTERGVALLDELGRQGAADEEQRGLRDKANLALGFAALRDGRAIEAREALSRVRLNGLQSNKALLGFGWAAQAQDDPKLALVPWTELAARDPGDSAVLEARIAVPHAYAQLGNYGASLVRYEEAIGEFTKENAALDESIAAIRAGRLVDGLLALHPDDAMGGFYSLRELPEMPHVAHLAPVLASHEFQEAFKNYRDLLFLGRRLADWADRLGSFGDMLDTRRAAFTQRLPEVRRRAREGDSGLLALRQRRDALAAELAQAQELADGTAFADTREAGLRERIARVRAALEGAAPGADTDALRERLRLAEGALTWQLAQQHPLRAWEATKGLAATDAALAEAQARDAALALAQRDEPKRLEAFAERIPGLGARIAALQPRVAALAGEQQRAVQGIAVAELQRQQERLAGYLSQARYAVAQLYDRGVRSAESPRAP